MKLGIQSYCLRETKANEELIAQVKELGLSEIEVCGVHIDFQDPAKFDEIVELYADGGIRISSIGVNPISGNEDRDRNLFEFAKKAGIAVMSATFPIPGTSIPTGEKLAAEYGIDLAVHNHGGRDWLGSPKALNWLMNNTSERIGINMDLAWMLDAGFDPVDQLRAFGKSIKMIHLKDFIFDRKGRHQDVIVGTGNIDLAKLEATLKEIGFDGTAVLEYEADPENPMPALKECLAKINAEMTMWD